MPKLDIPKTMHTVVRLDSEGGGTVCKALKLFWSTN
jgi:hypothetical protein